MQNIELTTVDISTKIDMLYSKCDETEKLFVNEYILSGNNSRAAIKAGLSAHTAAEQGSRMYRRPHVRAAIDAIFESEAISTFEIIKMTVNASKGNLADCMSTRKVPYTPKIKMPLAKIIDSEQFKVDVYIDYIRNSKPNEEDEKDIRNRIEHINKDMAMMEAELRTNPAAYRIEFGETVMRNEEYLDMKKVIAKGLIVDKVEHDKNGKLKVSIASPTVARQDLIRMAGLYEKDNKQKAAQVIINLLGDDAQLGNTISI